MCRTSAEKAKAFISAIRPISCADINIILAHAQRLDSWEDDRNVLSLSQAKMLENASREAESPVRARSRPSRTRLRRTP